MAINRKLLMATHTREIPISEVVERFQKLKGTTGEERIALQNQIAREIEAEYPLREEKTQKENGTA